MTNLFTIENSRLAALLHGDTNEVHKSNKFGKVIAPGLMQLQGFVSLFGWRENHMLEVLLKRPVVVPNPELNYETDGKTYSLKDNSQVYSTARLVKVESMPIFNNASYLSYNYSFTKENISLEDSDWLNYNMIPVDLVARIIPPKENPDLYKSAAVGVSANSLVRALKDDPTILPDLYFPVVRENGENACLEEKLFLYMGKSLDFEKHNGFDLQVSSPKESLQNERGIIATIRESSGLYTLEMHLTKISLRLLKRMLK